MVESEIEQSARRRLEELVSFMGVNAEAEIESAEDGIELKMGAVEHSSRLIGHHGETLRSIEYLVNQMVKHESPDSPRVSVDISGYREARKHTLEEKALETARKATDTGQEQAMRPMNPAERRIVHMALRDFEGVATESRGEGRDRHLVVIPAD